MQKYVYTLCVLSGTPLIAGTGSIISASELENIQNSVDKNEDTVVLQDGTALTGTLKSIPQLSYSFGNIPININDVAVIAFSPKSEKNKIQIITRDGFSYVADLPNENFIVIQYLPNRKNPKYTINKEVAPASIRYVTLKQREVNYVAPKGRIFDIELKNGDHIPASIASDSIALSTGLRDEKIKTDELLNLEVDFGIHGFIKNRQGQQVEFDFTYPKDKFLNLQIAQSQQTLGLPWALVSKIERIEPRRQVVNTQNDEPQIEESVSQVKTTPAKEQKPLVVASTDLGSHVEKKGQTVSRDQDKVTRQSEKEITNSYAELAELVAELQAEKQNSLALQKNLEELQARYQQADERAQKFQEEIEELYSARDSLHHELDAVTRQREEIKMELAQERNPEDKIDLMNRLAVETAKSNALSEQLNELHDRLERNDETTQQLMAKFEDEVKSLQLLLSGKQREVQFSEKELESTLKEIAQWRNAKGDEVYKLTQKQEIATEVQENLLHPIHLISDIDQLTLAFEMERNKALELQSNLNEALENYRNEELRARSLHEEYNRQLATQDGLGIEYSKQRSELESKVASLQQSLRDVQQDLSEKEDVIKVLTAAREELIFTVTEQPVEQQNQNKDEHQKHLISEIEQLSTALDKERESVSILQNNITELQARFAEIEQKRNPESIEPESRLADASELENKIAELLSALDDGQRQLAEKEESIKLLSDAKEDLALALAEERQRQEGQGQNQSSQAHFLSDIDHLTIALQKEQEKVQALQEKLEEMEAQLQSEGQRRLSLQDEAGNLYASKAEFELNYLNTRKELEDTIASLQQSCEEAKKQLEEKESEMHALSLSRSELERNIRSEVEALDGLVLSKQQRIEQLENEIEQAANLHQSHQNDFEQNLANMAQALEQEKISLAQKERELQEALERQQSLSQFASAIENQIQALTQRAASFGDEFELTQKKLNESHREFQALLEVHQQLHQQAADYENKLNEQAQQNHELQEHIISLTQKVKAYDQQLAEKTQEIDELRSGRNAWAASSPADDSDYAQNIQRLLTALDLEKQKAQHLEKELERLAHGDHVYNRQIEDLTAAIESERELTRQLGVQLQRVHTTETNFKKQMEQQAQKIASAEEVIKTLTSQNQAYQEELLVRQEEISKLGQGVNNLQELTTVVKNYENELNMARQEREDIARELANEKQAAADRDVLIERLSEIVRIQKSALERIENSQVALKD